jgi:hypothetical protein
LKSINKKIFIVLILAMCSGVVRSQVLIALLFGEKLNSGNLEFGLTGGPGFSRISNFYQTKAKTGLDLGLFFNIKLNNKWYLHPEAVPKFPTGVTKLNPYSLNDANLDSLLSTGDVTRKIKNIALPLLVRYKLKNLLFVEAGPQVGLRTKAKDVFESGNLTYENKIEENITRFDFGFDVGFVQRLSKDVRSMSLGVRYYFGLTDIDKLTTGSQKNKVFQILASIPIGAGKKQVKDEQAN